jgi:low temperature requirement protein LtrA
MSTPPPPPGTGDAGAGDSGTGDSGTVHPGTADTGTADTAPGLRVTNVELFFDLVFAFTLTQLTTLLSDNANGTGAAQTLLVFGLIWWMYGGYAWVTNANPPNGPAERLLLLTGMAGLLVAGLAIPQSFGRDGVVLGLGYLVVVLVHAALYWRVNRNIIRVTPFNVAAALLVTGAGLGARHGGARPVVYLLWVLAVALQVGSPYVIRPGGRFDLRPAHIVERHTAMIIIALGLSVAAVGIGAARLADEVGGITAGLVGVALLGLALSVALWWALFGGSEDERSERALSGADAGIRAGLVLDAYFYSLIPLLLGIVAVAAGTEQAIARAAGPHAAEPAAAAVLLGAGTVAVLAGDVLFRLALGLGQIRLRLLAAAGSAATIAAGLAVGLPLQLGLLLVVFAAMIVAEHRLLRTDQDGPARGVLTVRVGRPGPQASTDGRIEP